VNPGLELMPFQEEGATLLAQSRRAMLVWDAGVGKTPTAVRACLKAGAARILVFCPPIGTAVWRVHFEEWSDVQDIRIADSRSVERPYGFVHGAGVRIVPYSRARTNASVIRAACVGEPWDAVIIDEAHYLKSSGAQRTRAVYGDNIDLVGSPLRDVRHIWCLTGTPILNHPAEFWTHLHALAPETIILPQLGVMDETVFVDRFCVTQATPVGVRIVGARNNTMELAARIRPFAHRKRMGDVLKDMPPLRIVEHSLPADTNIDPTLRDALTQAIEDLGVDESVVDDDTLLAAVQAGGVAFSTVRRLIGKAKLPGVVELVESELADSEDDKIIVFAHHREVVEGIAERLKRHHALLIYGSTPVGKREAIVASFQTDKRYRVIVLQMDAASEVITLHASHHVIIAEPSPVPARNQQAIARAHRKGQKYPVLARFVLLPGTLDARLMSIVARKTREIARIVDGAPIPKNYELAASAAFPDTD
jgi:SWI/SNF-related matrix-associated actin-dependent regulator 1 of chromatin subfamily A